MSESLAIAALLLAGVSGVPGWLLPREGRAAERIWVALMVAAGACGLLAGASALSASSASALSASSASALSASSAGGGLSLPWSISGGHLSLRIDALSAVFVIQISAIAALGAIFGLDYWAQSRHPRSALWLRTSYGGMTAGMLLLVVAHNAVLFLVGWELMALAAFLALTSEHGEPEVRSAGYLYLLATRLGTLALYAMFGLLFAASGTLDFEGWADTLGTPRADAVFLLALLGFGVKAGIVPLHVWLPSAHASAPTHVSALMSGVLIKMGIYGLARITSLCDAPPLWWGGGLLTLGVVSSVFGVTLALGQHDLKRLLAYHSVENIGIICLGLGVAVLGRSVGREDLVVLGMSGALLHTFNHGLFKALLFLSAGAVLHATGTREIDRLGGLLRRMPATALGFLVGAVAICGLPPLNGLISELLVYLGLFRSATGVSGWIALAAALAVPALALVGGLALACFAKAFGVVFLGNPRSSDVAAAHEPGPAMLLPMALLALACALIGVGAPLLAPVLDAASRAWAGGSVSLGLTGLAPLGPVAVLNLALAIACLALGAWLVRRSRGAARVPTWDCGYEPVVSRAQYTASSWADSLVRLFGWILHPIGEGPDLRRVFPVGARYRGHLTDTVLDRAVLPMAALASRVVGWLKPIQRGSTHVYLVYILAAVIALLLWR